MTACICVLTVIISSKWPHLAPEVMCSNCTKVLVAPRVLLFFSERLINSWNRLPDSGDFISLPCFKRSLDTVDFTVLSETINFALCFVLCTSYYGQLLVPLAFLSYGTLSARLFFTLFCL